MAAAVFFSIHFVFVVYACFKRFLYHHFSAGLEEHSICHIYLPFLNCCVVVFFLIFHITSFYFCKTYHTFIKVHKTHLYRLTNNYKANTHVTTIQIKKHSRSPFPHIPPVLTHRPATHSTPLPRLQL